MERLEAELFLFDTREARFDGGLTRPLLRFSRPDSNFFRSPSFLLGRLVAPGLLSLTFVFLALVEAALSFLRLFTFKLAC